MSNKTQNTPENNNTTTTTQGATKMKKKIDTAAAVNHWVARKTWGEILRESGFAYRTEITDDGFKFIVHDSNDADNIYGSAKDVYFGGSSRWMEGLSKYMMDTLNTKGMSSIDKQKFVSEVLFQGDYEKMLKKEIIPFYENHLENIAVKEINSDTENDDAEDVEDVKDVETAETVEDVKDVETVEDVKDAEDVEDVNDEDVEDDKDAEDVKDVKDVEDDKDAEDVKDVEDDKDAEDVKDVEDKPKKETPEEKKARQAQEALDRWHGHLNAFSDKFVTYFTEEGSRAWGYTESPSVVTIGSSGDLISEVRNLYGDNSLPLKKDTAESIIDKIFLDLGKAIRSGEAQPVKRVNRFYTDKESGSSWVYTANADTEATSPFIKITADGVSRSEAPEGVVFDSAGELGEMEVDTSGTINDFWSALDLLNLPKEDRLLALGWLMTPVHATESARPGLLLRGGAGSGKTSTAVNLKNIIDPDKGTTSESLAPTGEKGAFLASLRGADTKIPGNLSGLSGTMSDAISQSMTGSRYERDEKYTENKLSWTIQVSMIFSTINTGMVLQGDLQDRIFSIDVPEIPAKMRALGDIVEEKWNQSLPKARGGLFALISAVKKVIKESGGELPVYGFRMIPAAKAMSAAEIVLEREGIEFTGWGDRYGYASTKLQRESLPGEIDYILYDLKKTLSGRPGEILQGLREDAFKRGFATTGWGIKSPKSFSMKIEENLELLETRCRIWTEPIRGKKTVKWFIQPILEESEEEEIDIDEFSSDVFG